MKETLAELLAEQGWTAPTADGIAAQCQTILTTILPALPVIGYIAHTGTLVLQAESPPYATLGRLATPKVIAQVNAHFRSQTVRAVAIRLPEQDKPTAPAPRIPATDPFVRTARARQEAQAVREQDAPLTDGTNRRTILRPAATVRARALARARAEASKAAASEGLDQ